MDGLWKWSLLVPVVLFALMMGINMASPEAKERSSQRFAIETCWEDQAKKSHAPDVARFIAGACEKLERDFVGKYGHKP